tara:strand:- start:2762 stop:3553 length:792 start_codon:yes stop_codon:yes gene_type:complete
MKQNFDGIVFIDVGTHKGQELMSMFRLRYIIKRSIIHSIKKLPIITPLLFKFSGNYLFRDSNSCLSFRQLIGLVISNLKFKKLRKKLYVIAIEPNHFLLDEPVYKLVDQTLCIGFNQIDSPDLSIKKLFYPKNDKSEQGATILKNYTHQECFRENDYFHIICGNPSRIIKELNTLENLKSKKIILRINCEGLEDDVIYSLHNHFKKNLVLVLGSLKDVLEIKGKTSYENLINFMEKQNIKFQPFNDGIRDWPKAHAEILQLIS